MPGSFLLLLAAQFASALADNALLIAVPFIAPMVGPGVCVAAALARMMRLQRSRERAPQTDEWRAGVNV